MARSSARTTTATGNHNKGYARRSRAGCWTCRRLHRKCDELKPKCGSCVRAKRHCEGYAVRFIWTTSRGILSRQGQTAKDGASEGNCSDDAGDGSVLPESAPELGDGGTLTPTGPPSQPSNEDVAFDQASLPKAHALIEAEDTTIDDPASNVSDEDVQASLLDACKLATSAVLAVRPQIPFIIVVEGCSID
jgi:hypothetical protein